MADLFWQLHVGDGHDEVGLDHGQDDDVVVAAAVEASGR